MKCVWRPWGWTLVLAAMVLHAARSETPAFTVATYNLENYLDVAVGTRPTKSAVARARVRAAIRALQPDVLALQEIGTTNALHELRAALQTEGLAYPYWEHVGGFDTNIFLGVLSHYPIVARRPHTNEQFLLQGRRFRVSRGFAEVDIRITPAYTFTLLAAHLKSRRPSVSADERELREQEALLLREKVDAVLRRNPAANLVVLGDFNDTQDSPAVRTVLGRGRSALVDTRPAERNGDDPPSRVSGIAPRNITWTHYYGKEDSYQRVDYLLLSTGMAREWDPRGTYVLTLPNWGVASDHRPIIARFFAEDR